MIAGEHRKGISGCESGAVSPAEGHFGRPDRVRRAEAGETIPGERVLAELYDISRVTLRKCIGDMVEDGYLIRHQGKETQMGRWSITVPMCLLRSDRSWRIWILIRQRSFYIWNAAAAG